MSEREMTLEEWVHRLPEIHAARREYESLRSRLAAPEADAKRWKAKALRQRAELRRLNKYLGPYWAGFRTGLRMEGECRLRGIMNDAFGHARVYAAEHAAIDAHLSAAPAREGEAPTGAGGNPRAYVCCEGVDRHADGCPLAAAREGDKV
jgi:hypothetical protein